MAPHLHIYLNNFTSIQPKMAYEGSKYARSESLSGFQIRFWLNIYNLSIFWVFECQIGYNDPVSFLYQSKVVGSVMVEAVEILFFVYNVTGTIFHVIIAKVRFLLTFLARKMNLEKYEIVGQKAKTKSPV